MREGYNVHMAFTSPAQNVEILHLTAGMRVADLGAGTGAYTIAAARAVGDRGFVYAIEVQKDLAEKLKEDLHRAGILNAEVRWADAERYSGTKIADKELDAVIVSNVFFQVADRDSFMSEIARIVKPGGKALVIDWSGSFGGMGPAPSAVVSEDSARDLFEIYGFSIVREIPAGDMHWGFIAQK